jgi:hypothetical protein
MAGKPPQIKPRLAPIVDPAAVELLDNQGPF